VLDLVLRSGWVADGTGAPPRRADLAVSGMRIAAVGHVPEAAGRTELEVTGHAGCRAPHALAGSWTSQRSYDRAYLSSGVA
jgi:N-acyl-D-amino-acid deacylase